MYTIISHNDYTHSLSSLPTPSFSLSLPIGDINVTNYMEWVDKYQAQLIVLAAQISWSSSVDEALSASNGLEGVLKIVESTLTVLADSVLMEQPPVRRKKLENLVSLYNCIDN